MGTTTHQAQIASTSNAQTFASSAFTPTAGDVVIVGFSPSVVTATTGFNCTASANSLTFFEVPAARTQRASVDDVRLFISTTVPASPVSMTVTADAGIAANGAVAFIATVSGLTRSGLSAIRNAAGNATALGVAPAATLAAAALTGNVVVSFVFNATSPSGVTIPTSFTAAGTDTGYATPTRGGRYAYRNSGHTSATVTWGSTSATAAASMVVELDVTTPAAVATGSLTLSGSGTASSPSTAASAAGSLDLGGTAGGSVPGGASGSLDLSATAGVTSPVSVAGSLSLTGSAGATGPGGASGSITLDGVAAGRAGTSASGSITFSGTATAVQLVQADGFIGLSGTAGGTGSSGASGSLTISGLAAAPSIPLVAEGFFTFFGSNGTVGAGVGGSGSIALGGSAGTRAPSGASGSLSLSGAAGALPQVGAVGSLNLAATAFPFPLVEAYGFIEFGTEDVPFGVGAIAEGFIEFSGSALLVRPPDLRHSRATLRPQTTKGIITPAARGIIRPPTTRGRIRS